MTIEKDMARELEIAQQLHRNYDPDPAGGNIEIEEKPTVKKNYTNEDKLVIADIMTQRFVQIFKERNIDVDKFAREHGGWFLKDNIVRHRDGTYDMAPPTERLKGFLAYDPRYLPDMETYKRMERLLGYQEKDIATFLRTEVTLQDFFEALGYKNEKGVPTIHYHNSPRVGAYRRLKAEEEKQRKEAEAKAYKVMETERKVRLKKAKDIRMNKIKRLVMGKFVQKEATNGDNKL